MPDHLAYDPALIVHSRSPLNAEPALPRLRQSFITSQRDFYIRSHGNIPRLDHATHRVRVVGMVGTPLDLTMQDLTTRFPQRTVTATLQCAGNRRADLQPVAKTSGDPWAPGAIGNARWTGVCLGEILLAAGADTAPDRHVAFECCDIVDMPEEDRFAYGVSIPIGKALSPDVLLAHTMNGEPLSPAHGYPLRAIVPGFAGVRSPKWLCSVTVQDHPSENHMQQRDYKLLPADVTEATVNWDHGVTINEMPLNAAICEPARGTTVKPGKITIRGYATATGRAVTRVDVSIDGGKTWQLAELQQDEVSAWSWRFWQLTIDLSEGDHELVVRAWDCAGQTQPADPRDVWNFKGYLSAAWHRVRFSVRA